MGARANRQAGSYQQGGTMNAVYLDRIQGLTLEECGQAIVELEAKLAEAEQRIRNQADRLVQNTDVEMQKCIDRLQDENAELGESLANARTALEAAEAWRDKYREDNWEVAIYVKDKLQAARRMAKALEALQSNPHLHLGDLVYNVRDSEMKGWEGPAVTQWSNAVELAKAALAAWRECAESKDNPGE